MSKVHESCARYMCVVLLEDVCVLKLNVCVVSRCVFSSQKLDVCGLLRSYMCTEGTSVLSPHTVDVCGALRSYMCVEAGCVWCS